MDERDLGRNGALKIGQEQGQGERIWTAGKSDDDPFRKGRKVAPIRREESLAQ